MLPDVCKQDDLGKSKLSPINHCHMLLEKWILQDTSYSSFWLVHLRDAEGRVGGVAGGTLKMDGPGVTQEQSGFNVKIKARYLRL